MDERLRAQARAARHEAEAGIDVDAELADVLARTPVDLEPRRAVPAPRRAIAWVASAAAAMLVVAGALVLLRSDGDDDTLLTAEPSTTQVATTAVSALPATTEPSVDDDAPATTVPTTPTTTSPPPTTVVAEAPPAAVIAVDIADPPPAVDLVTFAEIPFDEESSPSVAIGELGIVVSLPSRGAIESLGFSGQRRTIELRGELSDTGLSNLVYGPGDVVYGLHMIGPPFAFEMVAVPLSGDRAGEIVARSEPLSSATWVELPTSPFGHGGDGIVARARDVGATLIGYVDESGNPIEWPTIVPHFPEVGDDLVVRLRNMSTEWPLQVNGQRAPQPSFTGPAVPAPSTDHRTVYPTYLDPAGEGADQLPVVAILERDGTGSWASVPDGFEYVASDVAGTVFARTGGGSLELALLPSESVNWRSLLSDGSGISEPCAGCTQLEIGADGVPVTYDPSTRLLTRHTVPEVAATLPAEYGEIVFLDVIGPGGVAYLWVAPAVESELATDVVAVSLDDTEAGRELGRWPGVVNLAGDSELVATPDGLVVVGCCDHERVRPAADATVEIPWVGTGGTIPSPWPTFRVEVTPPTITVHRDDRVPAVTRSWTFELDDREPRGMPSIQPTFDGGFVAVDDGGARSSIVRGWTDGTVDTVRLDDSIIFPDGLDPSGRMLVANGGFFLRVEPFDRQAPRWEGTADEDDADALTLPGIDGAIDAGPSWALDPIAFADAVTYRPAVNEIRSIVAEQRSEFEWVVTVITSNFFDDSVDASRRQLVLTRSDVDGRFRFVTGSQDWACAPNRGHQDFSRELCI